MEQELQSSAGTILNWAFCCHLNDLGHLSFWDIWDGTKLNIFSGTLSRLPRLCCALADAHEGRILIGSMSAEKLWRLWRFFTLPRRVQVQESGNIKIILCRSSALGNKWQQRQSSPLCQPKRFCPIRHLRFYINCNLAKSMSSISNFGEANTEC